MKEENSRCALVALPGESAINIIFLTTNERIPRGKRLFDYLSFWVSMPKHRSIFNTDLVKENTRWLGSVGVSFITSLSWVICMACLALPDKTFDAVWSVRLPTYIIYLAKHICKACRGNCIHSHTSTEYYFVQSSGLVSADHTHNLPIFALPIRNGRHQANSMDLCAQQSCRNGIYICHYLLCSFRTNDSLGKPQLCSYLQ